MHAGKTFGPFTIEKELGSGAMGTVFRARLTQDGKGEKIVALKVIAFGLSGNDSALARFDREANILKQLKHPNIVKLMATGRYKASADPDERAKLDRYGIPDGNAVGIPMRTLLAKERMLGRDMALARALWASDGYEACKLAAMVADPDALTPADMDRWVVDFDSWAICDTVAFRLFRHSRHAFARATEWMRDSRTMVRRAG